MRIFHQTARAGIILLAFRSMATVQAQTLAAAPTATPHLVALAPDTCPVVHAGDIVTLDWNFGYSPAWPVTNVDFLSLRMRHPAYVTHGALGAQLRVATPFPLKGAVVLPNGYFHFELAIRGRTESGEYHIASMQARPVLAPSYQGAAPAVTNSPADAHLCIRYEATVPASPQASQTE